MTPTGYAAQPVIAPDCNCVSDVVTAPSRCADTMRNSPVDVVVTVAVQPCSTASGKANPSL
jgi:hypothetical protein